MNDNYTVSSAVFFSKVRSEIFTIKIVLEGDARIHLGPIDVRFRVKYINISC